MKNKFNKTWLIISLIIILNVVVFSFLSNKLESFVLNNIIDNQLENNF